ncbi:hypothetical protein [Mangrovicoccus algicola]|uniref:Uncharacterized protein n=1 Tax=Mangrovicoccus algicola TaxID=2771008 RepID=A0A8J6YQ47_9RHOB|nr:hypothetical protein [Mangrovicoccus algicola]MBE3637458.1 hypothetical protein [Mangrovicoccus algicola]
MAEMIPFARGATWSMSDVPVGGGQALPVGWSVSCEMVHDRSGGRWSASVRDLGGGEYEFRILPEVTAAWPRGVFFTSIRASDGAGEALQHETYFFFVKDKP